MPKKTASRWKTVVRPNTQQYKLNLIANNLSKIRHWDIKLGDYSDATNSKATWFIDPPYQVGGKYYKYGTKLLDYGFLSSWCKSRLGQVIVCEGEGGDWLPFNSLITSRGNRYQHKEYVWINDNITFGG